MTTKKHIAFFILLAFPYFLPAQDFSIQNILPYDKIITFDLGYADIDDITPDTIINNIPTRENKLLMIFTDKDSVPYQKHRSLHFTKKTTLIGQRGYYTEELFIDSAMVCTKYFTFEPETKQHICKYMSFFQAKDEAGISIETSYTMDESGSKLIISDRMITIHNKEANTKIKTELRYDHVDRTWIEYQKTFNLKEELPNGMQYVSTIFTFSEDTNCLEFMGKMVMIETN